jgi:hypothetical protein
MICGLSKVQMYLEIAMYRIATDNPHTQEPLLATILPVKGKLSLPGEATEETILVLLLNNLAVDNSEFLELARRNSSSVQNLDVGICPVLGLWLEPVEGRDDEELSADEQEHDLAEVRKNRRQHQSSELLADQGEGDSLRASSLRSSLLCDSPAVAADGTSVQHGPSDHEDKKGGVGSDV